MKKNIKKYLIGIIIVCILFLGYKTYICYTYVKQLGFSSPFFDSKSFSNKVIIRGMFDYSFTDRYVEKLRYQNLPDFVSLFAPKPLKSFFKITKRDEYEHFHKTKFTIDGSFEPPDDWSLSPAFEPPEEDEDEKDEDFWVAEKIEEPNIVNVEELTPSGYLPKFDEDGMPITKVEGTTTRDVYFSELIPKDNELYNKDKYEKLISKVEKIVPKNIEDFRDNLIPFFKQYVGAKKIKMPPSIEDRLNLSYAPNDRNFLYSMVNYWYLLSRFFEKNNEEENALLLSYGILWLMKDYETSYRNTGNMFPKILAILYTNKACNSMLLWASKPKKHCIETTKSVSKDILDFVANDFPLSSVIENDCYEFKEKFNEYNKKGLYVYSWIYESKYFEAFLNDTYLKSVNVVDKPFNEALKILDNNDREFKSIVEKKIEELVLFKLIPNWKLEKTITLVYLFLYPEKFLVNTIYIEEIKYFENLKSILKFNENKKAKMELTAIALAINAYVSENNKYPESMEELSRWMGFELPKNRFTNEPYKLNFNSEHVIYYNGIDGKADLSDAFTDDLYFDFSM